jgi:hypothetical protein
MESRSAKLNNSQEAGTLAMPSRSSRSGHGCSGPARRCHKPRNRVSPTGASPVTTPCPTLLTACGEQRKGIAGFAHPTAPATVRPSPLSGRGRMSGIDLKSAQLAANEGGL